MASSIGGRRTKSSPLHSQQPATNSSPGNFRLRVRSQLFACTPHMLLNVPARISDNAAKTALDPSCTDATPCGGAAHNMPLQFGCQKPSFSNRRFVFSYVPCSGHLRKNPHTPGELRHAMLIGVNLTTF